MNVDDDDVFWIACETVAGEEVVNEALAEFERRKLSAETPGILELIIKRKAESSHLHQYETMRHTEDERGFVVRKGSTSISFVTIKGESIPEYKPLDPGHYKECGCVECKKFKSFLHSTTTETLKQKNSERLGGF